MCVDRPWHYSCGCKPDILIKEKCGDPDCRSTKYLKDSIELDCLCEKHTGLGRGSITDPSTYANLALSTTNIVYASNFSDQFFRVTNQIPTTLEETLVEQEKQASQGRPGRDIFDECFDKQQRRERQARSDKLPTDARTEIARIRKLSGRAKVGPLASTLYADDARSEIHKIRKVELEPHRALTTSEDPMIIDPQTIQHDEK